MENSRKIVLKNGDALEDPENATKGRRDTIGVQ
jgi:hypothetical protein